MNALLVVDASAVVAALTGGGDRRGVEATRQMAGAGLVAPDIIGYEVFNALRGLRSGKKISRSQAQRALDDWRRLDVERWPLEIVEERTWELTDAMTAYDAAYVALAERLDVPLLTADGRLARASGGRAEILVV
ncbi:MAG TPA: type II toxin-antitoxin system VapC family toxin [Cellulomonas sp.]